MFAEFLNDFVSEKIFVYIKSKLNFKFICVYFSTLYSFYVTKVTKYGIEINFRIFNSGFT